MAKKKLNKAELFFNYRPTHRFKIGSLTIKGKALARVASLDEFGGER